MNLWKYATVGHLDHTVAAQEEAPRPRSLQSKVDQTVDPFLGFAMASSCSTLILRRFSSSKS
jgi:hypothetical protein